MGISYYICDECGQPYSDEWENTEYCAKCSNNFCSFECAAKQKLEPCIETWNREEGYKHRPLTEKEKELFEDGKLKENIKDGYLVYYKCKECRKETVNREDLYDFLLKKCNLTQKEAIKLYYENQTEAIEMVQ